MCPPAPLRALGARSNTLTLRLPPPIMPLRMPSSTRIGEDSFGETPLPPRVLLKLRERVAHEKNSRFLLFCSLQRTAVAAAARGSSWCILW